MRLSRRWLALSLLALPLLLTALAGCNAFRPSETMTVLAGSELKDIEPLLDEIERNTGVRLELEYTGTLNGVEALLDGADYDLAWFSHGKYLDLLQTGRNIVVTQEKTMLSPVVLGVTEALALSLERGDVLWHDGALVPRARRGGASAEARSRGLIADDGSLNLGPPAGSIRP